MVDFCPSDCTLGEKGKFGLLGVSMDSLQCKGVAGSSFWAMEVHPLLTCWHSTAAYVASGANATASLQEQLALLWPCLCCFILSHFRAEGADLAVICSLSYL